MDVRLNGAWVSPTQAEIFLNGAWRTLQYGEAFIDGAWRRIVSFVAPYTALSISPSSPSASSTSEPITSGDVTATPNGGFGPFTYSWSIVSTGGMTGLTINSPSTASTTFTGSVGGTAGDSGTATFRCIATDSLGTSQSATVSVYFEHSFPPGGTA